MNNFNSFHSSKKFYAREYFPFGIERSGEFSITQAKLLLEHGEAYQDLNSGLRTPINDEERAFVEVCSEEKPATTEHEKVWMRFLDKIQNPDVTLSLAGVSRSPSNDEFDAHA